ncbi:MAG: PQQ-dependent sugar dehydrogenase [Flectobacillus sp.]|nr:PQQ-dependent sugar dehydrogenase [Flectobacillus sp.]
MMKKLSTIVLLLAGLTANAQEAVSDIKLQKVVINDELSLPTAMAEPNDHSGRFFICEQEGRIRVLKNGKLEPQVFLDVSKKVVKKKGYEERGLLGLAFHPEFAKNRKFYVFCSIPVAQPIKGQLDHKSVVYEYLAPKKASETIDPESGKVVIEVDEPQSNHNGGDVKFGPDGYLYVSLGDGGGQNDKHGTYGNAQNMNSLLGKILRLDVNKLPYSIPTDNPFVNKVNTRPEIYAYGFRNPWRISFDKKTGQLFTGDVGQDNYEEVDIVTKGGNYGWRVREGLHPKFETDPDPKNWIDPINEYPHPDGLSITGGFVYRGNEIPALQGKYVFADWTGPIWALTNTGKPQWNTEKLSISEYAGTMHIYSFGEDLAGEIYMLTVNLDTKKGVLYKLAASK